MAEIADPPVIVGQEYRVKLGKSFTFPKDNAFHTIKYDFKPLSVDTSKPGRLKVVEGDEVNVSFPLVQAESVDGVAQFRGPKKACMKECVLIIDTQSGEAILEKISNTVQLKAVRDGRKPAVSRDRSISPSPYPPHKAQGGKASSTGSPAHGKPNAAAQGGSKGQKQQAKVRTKAPQETKGTRSPLTGESKPSRGKKSRKVAAVSQSQPPAVQFTQQPVVATPTMPTITTESVVPEVSPIRSNNATPEPIPVPTKRIKIDSEQSSDSSSSSSDSSESESDAEAADSHAPQQPPAVATAPGVPHFSPQLLPQQPLVGQMYPGHVPQAVQAPTSQTQSSSSSSSGSDSDSDSSSSSSGSSSGSSDQENDNEVAQAFVHNQPPRQRTMSQLRNDLQLSDSGSDSDS